MTEDAQNSITSWVSVSLCAVFFALTLHLLKGADTRSWQPWLTGVLFLITLVNVVRLVRARRNMRKAGDN